MAIRQYIKDHIASKSAIELSVETGVSLERVEKYLASLYEKRGIKEGETLLSLTLNINKRGQTEASVFFSDKCSADAFYDFVTNIRKGLINDVILEQIDSLLNQSNSRLRIIKDQLFPNGIVGIQPLIHPILTLMEN